MSIYRMPRAVVKQCEGVMRRFLWSGKDDKRGLSKVKWEEVTRSTTHGGLGIGRLQDRNVTLLFKWAWEVVQGNGKLWAEIVRKQYNLRSIGDLWKEREKHMSPIWSDIIQLCGRGSDFFDLWTEHLTLKLGEGKDTSFWWDPWAAKQPLALLHPRLYHLSNAQHGTVKDFGHWEGTVWEWHREWRRGLFEWENEEWASLRDRLPAPRRGGHQDVLRWDLEQTGKYSVHSGYKKWEATRYDSILLLRSCWTGLVPFWVEFFLWLSLRGRIVTRTFLERRNMITEDQNSCPMCNNSSEDATHLFLGCAVARRVWELIMRWLRVVWCQPRDLAGLWRSWEHYLPSHDKLSGRQWATLFYAVIWSLWKRRNAKVFRQKEVMEWQCVNMIFSLWHWWLKSKDHSFAFSLADMMQTPAWLFSSQVVVS